MRRAIKIGALVVLFAIAFVAAWIPLPYYAVGPGPVDDVAPLIDISGVERYPSQGRLVMTTVSWRQLTALESVGAWLDDTERIVEDQVIYPPGSDPQIEQERSISQMDQSKIDASVVVLTELFGYPEEHGDGALIEAVGDDCPASGELFVGDVVERIDDRRIRSTRDAQRALDRVPVDEPVAFTVRARGEAHELELLRAPCAGFEEPLVGINMVNAFPFEIEIASGNVGGPSAGLMFSLGLYDALTPGDLTAGRTVAGTGTISTDGTVGGITGIVEKVVGAERAGAEVFLVPRENMAEVRAAGVEGLQLIPVASFDQALAALEAS